MHTLKRVTAVACGDTHTAVVVTLSRPRLETIEGLKGEVDESLKTEQLVEENAENEDSTFDLSLSQTEEAIVMQRTLILF